MSWRGLARPGEGRPGSILSSPPPPPRTPPLGRRVGKDRSKMDKRGKEDERQKKRKQEAMQLPVGARHRDGSRSLAASWALHRQIQDEASNQADRSVSCHTVQDAGIVLAASVRAALFPGLALAVTLVAVIPTPSLAHRTQYLHYGTAHTTPCMHCIAGLPASLHRLGPLGDAPPPGRRGVPKGLRHLHRSPLPPPWP